MQPGHGATQARPRPWLWSHTRLRAVYILRLACNETFYSTRLLTGYLIRYYGRKISIFRSFRSL